MGVTTRRRHRRISGTVVSGPTLAALTVTPATIAENAAAGTVVGAIGGKTTGSTLSLTDDAGGRFAIAGGNLAAGLVATDYETATSHSVTIRETLAGSPNSPRDTVRTINVTDVAEGPAAPTAAFTMAQLGAANRVYQRDTTSGGGQGKGAGAIPVTISGASAGTINARCRSAADGSTILQPEWQAATIAGGATVASIAGVDARLGWFYLDLKGSDGSWQLGTVPVGMGRLIGVAGQSLLVCMFSRFVDGSTSIATAGASINPNGRALVTNTGTASGWQQFIDQANATGVHNAAGGAELLDRQIARFGVNCGLIGNAAGGSDITAWLNGQANNTELKRVIALAGGAFEAFWWFQGHTLAGPGYSTYLGNLTTLMADIAATSSRANPKFYLSCVPNVNNTATGNFNTIGQRNRAAAAWCELNGGVFVNFSDLALTDGTHPDQFSTRVQAWHLDRATGVELGAGNDDGPVVTRMVKSGVNLVCTVAQTAGGTALVQTGSAALRMLVTQCNDNAGTALALDATTPFTIDSPTQFTLKLAADPGDVALELWPMHNRYGPQNQTPIDGAANMLADNLPGAFPRARQLKSPAVPVFRRSNNSALTAATAYAAGRFAGTQGRSNGEMKTAAKLLPSWPWNGAVLEFWFRYDTAVTATTALVTQVGNLGVYLLTGGKIGLYVGSTFDGVGFAHTGMTAGDGLWHHLRVELNPIGFTSWFYLDGVMISQQTRSPVVGTATAFVVGGNAAGGGLLGTRGVISDVAYFYQQLTKGANFTPPAAPYTGTETGLVYLWKIDGNGNDSGPAG